MGEPQQLAAIAMVQAQFHAQRATLGALQQGLLPPESTLLEACGGRVPVTAVTELAQAAAAQRQRNAAQGLADRAADLNEGQWLQQGAGDAADGVEEECSGAQRLLAVIRDKLRHLAPQKRKVQHDVLLERSLKQCSQHQLLDWRRMRRPLPGSNQHAFEPPLQPMALLTQQAAQRAQRAAVTARADKLRQQRAYLERKQQEEEQQQQQQEEEQQQQQQQHGGTAEEQPAAGQLAGPQEGLYQPGQVAVSDGGSELPADTAQEVRPLQAVNPFSCDVGAPSVVKSQQEQQQQQLAALDDKAEGPPPPPQTLAQIAQ